MSWLIERRLRSVGSKLSKAREDLAIAEEQLLHLADESDDWEVRSVVSDDGGAAGIEHRDARRHADAMARHRQDLIDTIARLEVSQDDLLDRLNEGRTSS